jgi:hypothetical protein
MAKHYDNQSPYPDPEMIRRISILGEMWEPGMSDKQVNDLYEAVINPSSSNVIIGLIRLGYNINTGDSIIKLGDRNPI